MKIKKYIIFICILFLPHISFANNYLNKASKYTVKLRVNAKHPFGDIEKAQIWVGAGFLVDKKQGLVVSNAHVTGKGNTNAKLRFKNSNYVKAKIIYVDPEYDLAVLKIDKNNIPKLVEAATLDCGNKIYSGMSVAAFGHPKNLNFSSSQGIISQKLFLSGRDVLQTDAAINSGNSGGPLINLNNGKVIGVNKAKFSRKSGSEGLGFAVPIDFVCKIIELIKKGKDPSPPNLPLNFARENDSEIYNRVSFFKYKNKKIEVGSKLIKVNGQYVNTPGDVSLLLRGKDGKIKLTFLGKKGETTYSIRVKKQPSLLKRPYIFFGGSIIANHMENYEKYINRKFFIHSVEKGSLAEMNKLWDSCWILTANSIFPKNLMHLYNEIKSSSHLELVTQCWTKRDDLITQDYFIEMKTNDMKLEINNF